MSSIHDTVYDELSGAKPTTESKSKIEKKLRELVGDPDDYRRSNKTFTLRTDVLEAIEKTSKKLGISQSKLADKILAEALGVVVSTRRAT